MRRLKYPFTMLRIAPSLRCNFNCKHCTHFQYQKDIREKTVWEEVPPETWIKHLHRIEPIRDIVVIIGTGEPTLYKGISKIVNALSCLTSFYTNASDVAMKEIRKMKPRSNLYMYCSYHPTGISLKNFVKNAKWIKKTFNVMNFHAVCYPEVKEALEEDKRKMAESGLTLEINHPFTAWLDGKLYFYDDFGGDQPRFRNRFAGHLTGETRDVLCKVSANHAANNMSMSYPIAPNGDIYVCWRYFLAGSSEGILGNFFDEEFEYKDSYFECSKYGDCNICGWDRNIIDKKTGVELDNDLIQRVYV